MQTPTISSTAARLAAHDRKQAARKLANRLKVELAPLSPGFNVYDQGAKIAYLGRYKDFGNRWYYNVHGCPDDGFATSAEALEHLAARRAELPVNRAPDVPAPLAITRTGAPTMQTPTRQPIHWTYEPIDADDLSSLDLRAEAAAITGEPIACYRITRADSPTRAEAVWMTESRRVGIAWGATADWADYADIEQAIEDWVNHPDEFEARN